MLAISALNPSAGWAEATVLLSDLPSESLTINYSFATLGNHPSISSNSQSPLPGLRESTRHQNFFPQNLNTQSSSSVSQISQDEGQTGFTANTIGEEVPSYIIHEPARHYQEVTTKEVMNLDLADEQPVKDEEFPDFQDDLTYSDSVHAPLISQNDRLPSFSRFGWTFLELNHSLFPQDNSSEILLPWPVETPLTEGLTPYTYLARFEDVFHSDWEPVDPDTFSEYGTIPLVINDAVAQNLRYFQAGIPERFQSYLDRFHHYREVVEPIFREFGLPTDLIYLSLVESGFNPRAFSRARASGPWQFMKATGLMYKLNVNWYVDERRDPIKSTVAAAHHLRDLYDRFGSWPLALAAYNAGSGKVGRAIKKTGSRDFWKIRRTRHIRRETKDYVPRFIAATLIAKNPTAYGFLAPDGDRHEFEEVLIAKPVQLSAITDHTGISLEELKRLNPELRRNIVPKSNGPGYHLKVPVGMASLIVAQHATLPVWTQPPPSPTQWYTVRRGDSLSVVARRFGMKVRQLKDMNRLSSNLIRAGTKLRVRGGDEDYADNQIIWYRVRYGDSLGKIATRFRTSISQLKSLNNLSTHLIYPGDRLRVKGTSSPQKSPTEASQWYRVRRGDSLWSIAKRFSVSVRHLRSLNNLSSSIIRAGHMLMVSQ
ncbi:MAG: LysM peptidoglycan-binding domain-containing protein [Nitrospirales bacterium]